MFLKCRFQGGFDSESKSFFILHRWIILLRPLFLSFHKVWFSFFGLLIVFNWFSRGLKPLLIDSIIYYWFLSKDRQSGYFFLLIVTTSFSILKVASPLRSSTFTRLDILSYLLTVPEIISVFNFGS
jgi:hypothetical protein